jgi:hypothetical protein
VSRYLPWQRSAPGPGRGEERRGIMKVIGKQKSVPERERRNRSKRTYLYHSISVPRVNGQNTVWDVQDRSCTYPSLFYIYELTQKLDSCETIGVDTSRMNVSPSLSPHKDQTLIRSLERGPTSIAFGSVGNDDAASSLIFDFPV